MTIRRPLPPAEALERLRALCSRSEQCTADLRRKLYTWGLRGDSADRIIALLRRDRYVDDSRFAAAFTRDKYRFSGWGRVKISAALAAKSIDSAAIESALEEIDPEEYRSAATRALAAKARSLDIDSEPPRELCAKLLRFGMSRGYEYSELASIIKSGVLWQ